MMYCNIGHRANTVYVNIFPLQYAHGGQFIHGHFVYNLFDIKARFKLCYMNICCNEFHSNDNNYDWSKQMNGLIRCSEKYVFIIYIHIILLLSFQLKCSSNINSIHYLRLTNSFHQVPRDIHTLPVKEPIPSI